MRPHAAQQCHPTPAAAVLPPSRRHQSPACPALQLILLLLACCTVVPHAAAEAVALVAQPATPPATVTLSSALLNVSVDHIILVSNYTISTAEFAVPAVLTRLVAGLQHAGAGWACGGGSGVRQRNHASLGRASCMQAACNQVHAQHCLLCCPTLLLLPAGPSPSAALGVVVPMCSLP